MIVGAVLAIIFGAANAYLGLIVGMTVSASIPAAVISMAVLRVIMKRTSILENNIVQTITSTGESLAAGVIFTLPALFIWQMKPSLLTIDRKSTRLNSSHVAISYAVFCLKKKYINMSKI